jgi:hypothetical protein
MDPCGACTLGLREATLEAEAADSLPQTHPRFVRILRPMNSVRTRLLTALETMHGEEVTPLFRRWPMA